MTYIPRRTGAFDHATDAIEYVERRQCHSCIHQNFSIPEMPMCATASMAILAELPVGFFSEETPDNIRCDRWTECD